MKYQTSSGDTVDAIAMKLGYNGAGGDLLDANKDLILAEVLRRQTIPPGVELDVPDDWDQASGTGLVWNPDTHTAPAGGQPPMPLPSAQRSAQPNVRGGTNAPAVSQTPTPTGQSPADWRAAQPAAEPDWQAEARRQGWVAPPNTRGDVNPPASALEPQTQDRPSVAPGGPTGPASALGGSPGTYTTSGPR